MTYGVIKTERFKTGFMSSVTKIMIGYVKLHPHEIRKKWWPKLGQGLT